MPLVYVMTAEENYNAANVALIEAATPPLIMYSDQQDCGVSFDFQTRELTYIVVVAADFSALNNTGTTLWDGQHAVAPGGTVNTSTSWNLTIGKKNIDTNVVTFYPFYNSANLVPAGIGPTATGFLRKSSQPAAGTNIVLNGTTWTFVASGATGNQTNIQSTVRLTFLQLARDLNGSVDANISPAWYVAGGVFGDGQLQVLYKVGGVGGNAYTLAVGTSGMTRSAATLAGGAAASDGTWQRMNEDASDVGNNLPCIVNPHTNDVWMHPQSCEIYLLRSSDNFSQVISPFRPVYAATNDVIPVGVTATWFYGFEYVPGGLGSTSLSLYLIPSTIQTEETTLDRLLAYATFDFPTAVTTSYFRYCLDGAGNFYVISGQASGGKAFKFYKFTPPSAAPWGGTVVGGGFTNVTPWGTSTGPNTNISAYTSDAGGSVYPDPMSRNLLYFLPATSDFVCITKNVYQETGEATNTYDFAKTFYDCTYINVSGSLTFDYQSAFVTGYMASDWTTTNLAGATYAVVSCREFNLFLSYSDYTYATDYTTRWLQFHVQPVSGGVVDTDIQHQKAVLVQYQFISGAAPVVLQVIDEVGWDNAYPAYGSFIESNASITAAPVPVVYNSMVLAQGVGQYSDLLIGDSGLYDETTNSFWWSGADNSGNMYGLDTAFLPRLDLNYEETGPNPPFLKLSFAFAPSLQGAYYIERMDNREWPAVENVWCVDCALQTTPPTFNATLYANTATGAGIPTGVTGLFGGQGYSPGTTATIKDPTGTGAAVGLTIGSGIITAVMITGGTGYTYPQLVITDPAETGMGASATITLDNTATFQASAAVLTVDMVGEIIRMGGGVATITAFTNAQEVTANITTPIAKTIPNTNGIPAPQTAGNWSIAPQVSKVYGLMHLAGFEVTGVADGAVVTPRTVAADGSVTLDSPASLITLGLAFTPQFQSLYMDGGSPTVQGQRKKIAAATVRLDASGVTGIEGGSNQPTPSAQSPQVLSVPWPGMTPFTTRPDQAIPPYGSTTKPLFTGDMRQPVSGGFDKPGQVAFQQTLPLPMNIIAIVPEGLAGDQPEQTYTPTQQREPSGGPRSNGK